MSGSQAHSYSGHGTLHSYLGSGHHQEATWTSETRQWQEAVISILSRYQGLGTCDMLQTSAIAGAWAEESTCEE